MIRHYIQDKHTLYLGGSNCPTIALSESLDMSPPMHQDSRKNRGKNAPLGIFCQINFYGENVKTEKTAMWQNCTCYSYIIFCLRRSDIYKNHMRNKN